MNLNRIIEFLRIEQTCVKTASQNLCNRKCNECVLVQNDKELIEMYEMVLQILSSNIQFNIE